MCGGGWVMHVNVRKHTHVCGRVQQGAARLPLISPRAAHHARPRVDGLLHGCAVALVLAHDLGLPLAVRGRAHDVGDRRRHARALQRVQRVVPHQPPRVQAAVQLLWGGMEGGGVEGGSREGRDEGPGQGQGWGLGGVGGGGRVPEPVCWLRMG